MGDFALTSGDYLLILIVLISALVGFARGLLKEFSSIIAFLVAGIATLWGFAAFSETVSARIQPEWLANLILIFGIFVIVYVIVAAIAHVFIGFVRKGDHVGFADRVLGFAFGIVRGMIVAAIGFIVYRASTEDSERIAWIEEAWSRPYVEETADVLAAITPRLKSFYDSVKPQMTVGPDGQPIMVDPQR